MKLPRLNALLATLCIICTPLPLSAPATQLENLAQALKTLTPAIVTPTRAIELLKKEGALIYEDNINHIYQIKVTPQGPNECWMHGSRNTLFLTAMFSGVTEQEFYELYQAMLEPENIEAFKNQLRKNPAYTNAIDTCARANTRTDLVSSLIADGKQIPKNSSTLEKTWVPFIYYEGLDPLWTIEKSRLTVAIPLIKEAEGLEDSIAKNLAHEAVSFEQYLNRSLEQKLQNNPTSFGIELSFFTGMPHDTALVVCKENNTTYYFFANSYRNDLLNSTWEGRAEANIKRLKLFIENEQKRKEMRMKHQIIKLAYFCQGGSFGFVITKLPVTIEAMLACKTTSPELFKKYRPLVIKLVKEAEPRFTGTKEQWEDIEKELKKLENT